MELRRQGFTPDIMATHLGWGDSVYLKDVWPNTPLLGYCEFFYRLGEADVGFDPEFPSPPDSAYRLRTNNAVFLMGLDAMDWGHSPTHWQRSLHPPHYQDVISVAHEGVDTEKVKPRPDAGLSVPALSNSLTRENRIVTYVARNLEPYRGFHSFMRAVPEIHRRDLRAHVVVVGGDGVSYGQPLPNGETHRHRMMAEVGGQIDPARLHFLGSVPYDRFLAVLQVSSVHVYLTYPFVLSWSLLEAMATGCAIVGSATPPVEEVIVDGFNGLLVDFFSPPRIAETIIELLASPSYRDGLGANARQTILERYDLASVCLPAFLSMAASLAEGRRPAVNTP